MTEHPGTRPDQTALGDETARQVLARAIELDHLAADGVSTESLRDAAREAGISAQAFNAALSETMFRSQLMSLWAPQNPPKYVRLVHRVLIGVLTVNAASFSALAAIDPDVPLMHPGANTAVVGEVLAAFGAAAIALALRIIGRRIPRRSPGQTDHAFWSSAYPYVIPFWAVFGGSGIIGAVGTLLTGHWAPAALFVAALIGLFVFRPSRIERE